MRTIFLLLMFGCCFIAADVPAQVVETTIAVELSASDRIAIGKAACGKSGKRTLGIQGRRSFLRRDHQLTANVLCEDAVENDTFRAYFPRTCTKKGARWKCSKPGMRLHIDVAGGGPYEINECFWLEYPRQCRADGAEPVQVTVKTGCIDE